MTTSKGAGGGVTERPRRCVAFAGDRRIAAGDEVEVAVAAKAWLEAGGAEGVLVFDEQTSEPVELDLRGSAEAVRRRAAGIPAPAGEPRGPGRPRLGVVAREVTLLPRHWEWLAAQPGGASVALRKLVEAARRTPDPAAARRQAQESTYRFLSAMAGNAPGFEEATRALFAGQRERFERETTRWPADVREHALRLALPTFPRPSRRTKPAGRGPSSPGSKRHPKR